jgi:hypothetical protein
LLVAVRQQIVLNPKDSAYSRIGVRTSSPGYENLLHKFPRSTLDSDILWLSTGIHDKANDPLSSRCEVVVDLLRWARGRTIGQKWHIGTQGELTVA